MSLPRVKLKDLDFKWACLLVVLLVITMADDVTGVGWLLDAVELPVDVVVGMILQRRTLQRAAKREAATVQGRVVEPEPAQRGASGKKGG